jgi:hypothetical protein
MVVDRLVLDHDAADIRNAFELWIDGIAVGGAPIGCSR